MKDQICVLDKVDKTLKSAILHTNEDATIYFKEVKTTRKINIKRVFARIKSSSSLNEG